MKKLLWSQEIFEYGPTWAKAFAYDGFGSWIWFEQIPKFRSRLWDVLGRREILSGIKVDFEGRTKDSLIIRDMEDLNFPKFGNFWNNNDFDDYGFPKRGYGIIVKKENDKYIDEDGWIWDNFKAGVPKGFNLDGSHEY